MTLPLARLRFSLRGVLLFVLLAACSCSWLARARRTVLARQEFRTSAGSQLRMVTAEAFGTNRKSPCSFEKNVVPNADAVGVAKVSAIRRLWGDEAIQAILIPRNDSASHLEAAESLFPEAQIVCLSSGK
jgi:hypothetical protein